MLIDTSIVLAAILTMAVADSSQGGRSNAREVMRQHILAGLLVLSLGACASQGPQNQYFPAAYQKEMFSASHWKILAAQTAVELRQDLPSNGSEVWLKENDDSSFAQGFDEFLATELVHRGLRVSREHGDTMIEVWVEVVQHSRPPADPYKFTFLGAVAGLGVWFEQSSPINMAADAIPPVAAVAGAVIDAKRDLMPPATSTEVIVSTRIFQGDDQVAGRSDVFYIQTPNSGEYNPQIGRIIPVVAF